MKPAYYKTPIIIALVVSLLSLGGCGEGMRASDIYGASLCGALVGGIVGYQSHEEGEGAAIGAALFGVGELLNQLDNIDNKESKDKDRDDDDNGRTEIYVIQVHNSNGSITPIEIEKKGNTFIGPKGEHYESLPTEEQLKPVYGF